MVLISELVDAYVNPPTVQPLSSRVIKDTSHWAGNAWLIPHEPARYDLALALKALQPEYFDVRKFWKVTNWFKWYSMFDEIIHHHHHVEEDTIWPYFKKHGVPFDDKMYDDHKTLLAHQHEIVKLSNVFLSADKNDYALLNKYADELRVLFTKVKDEYEAHFAEEEESAEVIAKILTEKEWDVLEKQIVADSQRAKYAFLSFGNVGRGAMRWGGNARLDQIMSGMPWFVKRWALNNWLNAFIAEYLYPILSIQLDEQPAAPIKKRFRPGPFVDWYFPQDMLDGVPSVKAKRQAPAPARVTSTHAPTVEKQQHTATNAVVHPVDQQNNVPAVQLVV